MTGMLLIGSVFATSYASLLGIWFALGFGYALTLLPIGRVLRRSSHAEDRPALFAAHFAVSHAAWLVAYPSAGFVSAALGPQAAFVVLALLCIVGAGAAHVLWPRHDPENIPHTHADLPPDHPHFGQGDHVHPYIVDDLHTRWPRRTASD
jgi:predicted MFS family arabinose efflux permease